MRFCYSLLFYLLVPLALLRLCWRALRAPAYAQRWAERFGFFAAPAKAGGEDKPLIWLHAVSVGETLAALPLIRALQSRYPGHRVMVTTSTPTGSERVRASLGDSVFHVYAPYDLPDALARFLKRTRPCLLVVMETELWPNTIAACHKRGIPIIVANARLSEKSARGYGRFAAMATPMLQRLSCVAAQHRDDAARFLGLGLPPAQCEVTGSIKFDLTLDDELRRRAAALKQQWSLDGRRSVCIAASTHQGEDELVLQAFAEARRLSPQLFLVLVPRHPERFERVAELCRASGFTSVRRSQAGPVETADILLGDTMGELLLLLGAADFAFVGGSLVPTGGHNMIEAAAWQLPVLSGPHLFNFAEASRLLTEVGAMRVVEDAEALGREMVELSEDSAERAVRGAAGLAVAEANRGALARLLTLIDRYL